MRKRLLASLGALLTGTSLALSQPPAPPVISEKIAAPAEKTDGFVLPMIPHADSTSTLASDDYHGSSDGHGKDCGPRVWGSFEYLLWWVKDAPLGVPIATTGDVTDVHPGALGQPGTAVVSPDRLKYNDPFSGGRFTVGLWVDDDRTIGIEGGGFSLQSRSARFSVSSPPGGTLFYVPYINAFANFPPFEDANTFGVVFAPSGSIEAVDTLRIWGAEVNGLYNLVNTDNVTVSLLGGFRYLNLREDFDLLFVATDPTAPFATKSLDHFGTRNQFWGGQLGARGKARFGGFFANVTAKVALGEMQEEVNVIGNTNLTTPVLNVTVPGGFFTQLSNGGRQVHDAFAVVPQVGVQAGYDVTSNLRAFVGYDFLYVSDVLRPGDQLDRRINFDRQAAPLGGGGFTGPVVPVPQANHTDFWAQGLSVGLQISF